ncbi:anthrone oxygenase family protein [Saccharomonospora sp. NPDC046836]|uniref:anthrone oxygenase family protein n=1 Tax=Saccharomonospora sp. NPDC046836 TaxID=3156921 RepID=UPI0033E5DD54
MIAVLTVLAIVGCGLMAGLFFAFSTSVMPGLSRLPKPAAALAMQEANRRIQNPLFLLVFLGTALVCVLVAVAAPVAGHDGAGWLVAGALVYVVGGFVVTMVVNVPMNNRIDRADPDSSEGAVIWTEYLSRWTAWNHLRALAATLATALLAVGLA